MCIFYLYLALLYIPGALHWQEEAIGVWKEIHILVIRGKERRQKASKIILMLLRVIYCFSVFHQTQPNFCKLYRNFVPTLYNNRFLQAFLVPWLTLAWKLISIRILTKTKDAIVETWNSLAW